MHRWMLRLTNVSAKTRFYQATNWFIVRTMSRPLKISYLVEYPKCGGSWVRNMMQSYLGGRAYFVDRMVTGKTVIQVHRRFNRAFRKPTVVVRDPRDMLVSAYYADTKYDKRPQRLVIDDFLQFFWHSSILE